jgi:hypothetical protein
MPPQTRARQQPQGQKTQTIAKQNGATRKSDRKSGGTSSAKAQPAPLGPLTPAHIFELKLLFTSDKLPTVSSRRAWAEARGADVVRVHRYWLRMREKARKAGVDVLDTPFQLEFDAEPPKMPEPTPPPVVIKPEPTAPDTLSDYFTDPPSELSMFNGRSSSPLCGSSPPPCAYSYPACCDSEDSALLDARLLFPHVYPRDENNEEHHAEDSPLKCYGSLATSDLFMCALCDIGKCGSQPYFSPSTPSITGYMRIYLTNCVPFYRYTGSRTCRTHVSRPAMRMHAL